MEVNSNGAVCSLTTITFIDAFTLLMTGVAAEWPSSAVGVSNIGYASSSTPGLQPANQSVFII